MKKIIKIIIPVIVVFLLGGCAKHKNVLISSFSSSSNDCCFDNDVSFSIIPIRSNLKIPNLKIPNNVLENNSLLEKEITRKIKLMLSSRGFNIMDSDSENSDYVLIYSCTMPSKTFNENVPIYLPGGSSYTYGSIGGSFYSETSTAPGSYSIVPVTRTYFYKGIGFLVVRSSDYSKTIWNASASIVNRNCDYRSDVDFLIKAVFNYFGKSSNKKLNEKINTKDTEIKKLQNL